MKTNNRQEDVTQALRAAIAAVGRDGRLPSVRALMTAHGVGPVTVQRAFASLVREGLIEPRPGQGTFVRSPPKVPVRTEDLAWQAVALGAARAGGDALVGLSTPPGEGSLVLSTGYLPLDLQPTRLLAAAIRDASSIPAVWDRTPSEGLDAMRAWFAGDAGGLFSRHEVVICSGGQSAISVAVRALVPPGETLLVEAPTYVGTIAAARAAGLILVPVPSDAHGVRPDLLAAAFHATGARAFYCQPTFANPTGAVLTPERRAAVLDVVKGARAFAIEDDCARDLAFQTPPPTLASQDRDGHVVLIRSLAKGVAPGMRVAAIMARGAALVRISAIRASSDLFVSGVMQAAALALVTGPNWKRHLHAVRRALEERRDVLTDALRTDLGRASLHLVPSGGMHLWVRLPDTVSDVELATNLAGEGVVVSAGHVWFPAEPPGSFLRLSFAASEDVLRRGVSRIRAAMERLA